MTPDTDCFLLRRTLPPKSEEGQKNLHREALSLSCGGDSHGVLRAIDSGADEHAPGLAILRRRPVREPG